MNETYRKPVKQEEKIVFMDGIFDADSTSGPTKAGTPVFAPSIGQISDPAAVASDALLYTNGRHVRVSEELAAYFNRRRSWFRRLFWPTALDRILSDSQLRQAKTECEMTERILALATQMKFEACREVGEAWVKSLKVGVRESFTAFVTERYNSLQATLETRRIEFGHHISERHRTWESYHDLPELGDRYKASIDREIEHYFDWLDQLLAGFRSIIDEKLGEYNRDALPSP